MPLPRENQSEPNNELPKVATTAVIRFLAESLKLGEFREFMFWIGLQDAETSLRFYEHVQRRAAKSPVDSKTLQRSTQSQIQTRHTFRYHSPLLAEMVMLRMADNYLTYLSELLTTVFLTRPEMLKSGEQVRIDFVLQHVAMPDLVASLAERKVDRLSYIGMKDLAAYFSDELKLPLFSSEGDLARAIRIIETRNIIVHNRGVVNERYTTRVHGSALSVGERVALTTEDEIQNSDFLAHAVYDVDTRAIAKYKLESVPLRPVEGEKPST